MPIDYETLIHEPARRMDEERKPMTIEVTQEDRSLLKFLLASHEDQAARIDAGLSYTVEVGRIARYRQAAYEKGQADYEASMIRVQQNGLVK